MTEKLFTVAGTATHNGTTKVRFANDLVARIKILVKAGATDINLMELPQPMTKLQALKYLSEQGITDGDANYAVDAKLAEKSRVAKNGEVKVAGKSGLEAIRARGPKTKEVTAHALITAAFSKVDPVELHNVDPA
jgi:hypothetical protein